jgi:hypothetical protein
MLTNERLSKLLVELSKDGNPKHLVRNHAILGEVLSAAFPPGSGLSAAHQAIGKRFGDIKSDDDERPSAEMRRMAAELQELAKAADKLLDEVGPFYSETARTRSEREVEQLVNQAYHQSRLFTVTKWILAISLSLLGIGSLGYVGVNLIIMDRIQTAQDKAASAIKDLSSLAADINIKRDEITKSADSALSQVDKAVSDIQKQIDTDSGEITKKFNAALEKTTGELSAASETATKAIAKQQGDFQTLFDTQTTQTTQKLSAAIEKTTGELTTASGTATRAITKQQSDFQTLIDTESTETKQKLSTALDKANVDLAATLKTASEAIDRQQKNSVAELQTAAKESAGKFDSKVDGQLNVVNAAANNGSQRIVEGANAALSSLSTQLEQKKAELDLALQRNVNKLDQALTDRLPDINQKAIEAAKKLDAIVSDSEVAESRFTSGLKVRLTSWDQKITDETTRVDALAKSMADVKSNIDGLDQKLTALQKSSTAALEVAQRLSAGTRTDDLRWIGTVLEKSACFLLGIVGLAGLSLLLSVWSLYHQRRHRRLGHTPAAPV